jgi:Predicted membrane protein (DUF2306)
MATVVPASPRRPIKALRVVVGILVLIMLGAVVRRMVIDVPNVIAGTLPEATYDVRFVRHHWIAYLHIGPGALYLLGACLQLAYRFRGRHYTFHRRLGRVLVGTALLSGVFAIVIGILFPFGGIVQGAAAVVFGLWFITCLILAVRGYPPRRHVPPPPVDDPGVRRRNRGRHDPDLGRLVPWLRPARFRGRVRAGVLDLLQPARCRR